MIHIEQRGQTFSVSTFNSQGQLEIVEIPVAKEEMFEWKYAEEENASPIRSWNNKPVRKQKTDKFLSKWRVEEIFEQKLTPEQKSKIYSYNLPELWFCDIETEVTDGFEDPKKARNKVLTICLCNQKEKVIVLGIKPLGVSGEVLQERVNKHFEKFNKNIEFHYIEFQSESDMLHAFFTKYLKKIPALTGWYFLDYDWEYLYNRAALLSIEVAKKFPYGSKIPLHKMIFDYKEVYEKWDRSIEVKENGSLDFVSQQILGIRKVKFQGSFSDLYNNKFDEFVFYNAVDTYLVRLIDEKIGVANTYIRLAEASKVPIEKAFSPIYMTESMLCRRYLEMNKVYVNEWIENRKSEQFEGAYVQNPIPGLYEWIALLDYASLYPSIMRQWNISPESIREHVPEDQQHLYHRNASGFFFSKEESALKSIIEDLFAKRVQYKGKAKEMEKLIKQKKQQLLEMV